MASTVHQTWGNFLSRRIGCLPARPLASALRRLERLIRSPLYTKPSRRVGCLPARPLASALRRLERLIEIFLLHQIPSCFPAGPWIYTGLSCLSEHRCFYLSFPSVLEVFSFPSQGIPDEPPNVLPDVRIPEREERSSKAMQFTKREVLLLTRVRAFCCNQHSGARSEKP
ncbi:unnamed protein product [Rangifer tarandus platyrhynchus]|uniref:Uncharacterized protein n=2 Tax=Rangifer tarandus platyrhynchus TaxID=3082113 RepID=A0AC59Z1Q9_RANTA|nr:unnamed protein product [Rangifer tarandus platyrhynchus]